MDEDAIGVMLPGLMDELSALAQVAPRAVVSEGYFSFCDLRRAYDEVRRCLSSMKCSAGMEIGYACRAQDVPTVNRINTDMVRQLEHAAHAQQRERFERLIERSGIYSCQQEGWTLMELAHSVNCITWILQHQIEENRSGAQRAALDSLQELLLTAVDSLQFDQMKSLLMQMMDEYFEVPHSDSGSEGMRHIVRRVKSYIDAHYDEEISLGTLAQRFSVDDSYLSRMFKQQVGSNLMLYLASARIEQAKRLLAQKDLNITDVAQLVGYDDYAYFSRVFKRMEGRSPRTYREEEVR